MKMPPLPFLAASTLLAAALVPGAFLRGEVLSQAHLLYRHSPWSAYAPAVEQATNPLLSDPALLFYPFLTHTVDTVRSGTLPLWNSASYAGHPFLGSIQTAVFSPFTAIAYIVPLPRATVFISLAPLVFGALGMFLFVRALGLNVMAAWFGGLAYLLNGFAVVWMEHPVGAVACWAPWLLRGIDALLARQDMRRVGEVAVVVALTIVSGHPETATKVLLLGILYAIAAAAVERPPRSYLSVIAIGAGALLSAIQIVPFLEYLEQSEAFVTRGTSSMNQWFAPASAIIAGIVPDFFGNPADGTYLTRSNRFGIPTNYAEHVLYPGIAVVLLATVGFAARRREWRVRFFATAAIVSGALMFGLPGVLHAASAVPFLDVMILSRFGLIVILSTIVLAAYAVDRLTSGEQARWRIDRTVVGVTCAAVMVIFAGYLAALSLLGAHGLAEMTLVNCLIAVLLLVGMAALTLLRDRRTITARAFSVAACSVLAADLLVTWWGFHPTTPAAHVYPPVPEVEIVRRDPGVFRVYGWADALVTNTGIPYGLQDARGWDGMNPYRYTRLLDLGYLRQATDPLRHLHDPSLLDLLNVKYVFTSPDVSLEPPRYRLVDGGRAPLYLNTRAFPRAFLVDRYRVLDDRELIQVLHDGTEDLSAVALLEQELPESERPVPLHTASPDPVRIVHYRDTYVELAVESSTRALLVMSDAYYPGWTATVSGRDVPIHRANFALRAVSIPEGKHTVRFTYRPMSVIFGALISAATVLTLATALLLERRHTRARRTWHV